MLESKRRAVQGWGGVKGVLDGVDEDHGRVGTMLPPGVTSPPSKSFKIVLTKRSKRKLGIIENNYEFKEEDADLSKESCVAERESTSSGGSRSGDFSTGSKGIADKEEGSTSSDGSSATKELHAVMLSGTGNASTALALVADEV